MTVTQTKIDGFQRKYTIVWEKLPADFQLPDDPLENIDQPLMASALRDALELAGFIQTSMLIATNMGVCAKVESKTIVKAPDWFYVPSVLPLPEGEIRRSYTPNAEGDIPAVVMEFLSETDGNEYSYRPKYPYGKAWFYEQILQVPIYVIFDSAAGLLEVRHLRENRYELQQPDANGRYWIESMRLFLGVWEGTKAERTGYWLRWWDESGNLLLWGFEQVEQERQRAEQERQRAEAAERRVAELMEQMEQMRSRGVSDE